jgi:AraC-like DNA-binding protein/quercetin dioxygenase-like cupin family protein
MTTAVTPKIFDQYATLVESVLSGERDFSIASWGRRTLEASWGFKKRKVDADVIYFVLEGALFLGSEKKVGKIKSGELLWVPSFLPHELVKAEEITTVIHLRVLWKQKNLPGLFPSAQTAFLPQVVKELTALSIGENELGSEFTKRASLALVLLELAKSLSRQSGGGHSGVSRALAWANSASPSQWTLAKMAEVAELSQDRFSRAFTKEIGSNLRSWMLSEKLNRAQGLLSEGNEPIKLVAARCGWDNALLFSRLFRQAFGMSPKAWRRRDK